MRSDRRFPKQERARLTVDAILDAATQILAKGGRRALTTNAVAERAGVSIGTLYQYFADKDAILVALADRILREDRVIIFRALEQAFAGPGTERIPFLVREVIAIYRVRPKVRRAVMAAMIGLGRGEEVAAPTEAVGAWLAARGASGDPTFADRVFVAARSIEASVRAAAFADPKNLASAELEASLVKIARTLLPELST